MRYERSSRIARHFVSRKFGPFSPKWDFFNSHCRVHQQLSDGKKSEALRGFATRYAEMAPIPLGVSQFHPKYDRLLYGTDMGFDKSMYKVTFRIPETPDEQFYESEMFSYHCSLNGFGLSDEIRQKLYRANAERLSAARRYIISER
jgi:hypothetical protein